MFNSLLIKRNKFTLIELIVVIGILAILTSLVMPNIKGIESEAKGVALATERKSVQTAVDMYAVDHVEKPVLANETIGEVEEITIENPGIISMDKLYPGYLRDFPSTADAKYWLDYSGKVWVSFVDAPTGFTNNNGTLSWNAVEGAVEYIIYEYTEVNSRIKYDMTKIGRTKTTEFIIEDYKPSSQYLIQSTDKAGNKSTLVGGNYTGYVESIIPNVNEEQPIINKASTVAASAAHSGAIINGELYMWGRNTNGELGVGDNDVHKTPTKVLFEQNEKVIDLAVGAYHSVILTDQGNVYTMGKNDQGQLGITDIINSNTPQLVENLPKVKGIKSGFFHVMVETVDNELYVWGGNSFGQLGVPTEGNASTPILLKSGGVKAYNARYYQSSYVTDEGKVFMWGANTEGQLGHGFVGNRDEPIEVDYFTENNIKIKNVYHGGQHNIFLDMSDNLYSVGKNNFGQLGVGYTGESILTPMKFGNYPNVGNISLGYHNSFIKVEDTLYTFGDFLSDNGDVKNIPTPVDLSGVEISEYISGNGYILIKDKNGNILSAGKNTYNQLGVETPDVNIENLQNVTIQ